MAKATKAKKMPEGFSEWYGVYLLTHNFIKDGETLEKKIEPLTTQLAQANIQLNKWQEMIKHPDNMLQPDEIDLFIDSAVIQRRKVEMLERQIRDIRERVFTKKNGDPEMVYENIMKVSKITHIEIEGDNLKIFTSMLHFSFKDEEEDNKDRTAILGRMVIVLNKKYDYESWRPLIYNLDFVFDDGHASPTSNESGMICPGTWDQDFKNMDRKGDLAAYIQALVVYLQFPGDSNAGYCSYQDWDKNKEAVAYEPKLILATYSRPSSSVSDDYEEEY